MSKRPRTVAIVIPILANVHPRVVACLMTAMYRWGKSNHEGECRLYTPLRVPIDVGRNLSVNDILRSPEIEFVLFIDEDTEVDLDIVSRLVDRMDEFKDLAAIQPRYYIRGYPYELMAFGPDESVEDYSDSGVPEKLRSFTPKEEEDLQDENGMLWCYAIGNSCSMIRTEILRKIEPPWFATGKHHTEDIYFYSKLHAGLKDVKVAMDMTFTCGHQLGMGAVFSHNVELLRNRYEGLMKKHGGDHEYLIYRDDPSLGRV